MTGFRATIWSGIGALLFGGLLGFAAVDGVRPQRAEAVPIYPRAAVRLDAAADTADMETACTGCTTYDDGYRWASGHGITETDACFDEDWSHQSGCLAYVRARRLE